MKKKKTVRFDEHECERIEEDAKVRGQSEQEWMHAATMDRLSGKTGTKPRGMLEIKHFPIDTTCPYCKKPIRRGEKALYHSMEGVMCMKCAIERGIPDKTLVALTEKQYLLKRKSKVMTKDVEENTEENLRLKQEIKITRKKLIALECFPKLEKAWNRYLSTSGGSEEEKKAFEEMKRFTERGQKEFAEGDTIKEQQFAEILKRRKKKKKQIAY